MNFTDLKIGDKVTYMHRIMDRWYLSWDWYEVTGIIIEQLSPLSFLVRTGERESELLTNKDDIIKIHNK